MCWFSRGKWVKLPVRRPVSQQLIGMLNNKKKTFSVHSGISFIYPLTYLLHHKCQSYYNNINQQILLSWNSTFMITLSYWGKQRFILDFQFTKSNLRFSFITFVLILFLKLKEAQNFALLFFYQDLFRVPRKISSLFSEIDCGKKSSKRFYCSKFSFYATDKQTLGEDVNYNLLLDK